jgi:hypothetical protein
VGRFLDDEACNQLIASLIWLQGQNSKDPITLYFNVRTLRCILFYVLFLIVLCYILFCVRCAVFSFNLFYIYGIFYVQFNVAFFTII